MNKQSDASINVVDDLHSENCVDMQSQVSWRCHQFTWICILYLEIYIYTTNNVRYTRWFLVYGDFNAL